MHRQLDGTPATMRLVVACGTGRLGSTANPCKAFAGALASALVDRRAFGLSSLAKDATLCHKTVPVHQGYLSISVSAHLGSRASLRPSVNPFL